MPSNDLRTAKQQLFVKLRCMRAHPRLFRPTVTLLFFTLKNKKLSTLLLLSLFFLGMPDRMIE